MVYKMACCLFGAKPSSEPPTALNCHGMGGVISTLRPRQNGRRFDTFKRIFLNENVGISIKISLQFVPKGPINNNPALVQIMAWRQSGDKPLSEPMVVSLLTHICVTRPPWTKALLINFPISGNFYAKSNLLDYLNHFHIWQISLQLCCHDTS